MSELQQQTRESLRKLIDAANGAELTYTRAPKREEADARDKWRSAEKALRDALDALLAERDEARSSLAKTEARLNTLWRVIDDNGGVTIDVEESGAVQIDELCIDVQAADSFTELLDSVAEYYADIDAPYEQEAATSEPTP